MKTSLSALSRRILTLGLCLLERLPSLILSKRKPLSRDDTRFCECPFPNQFSRRFMVHALGMRLRPASRTLSPPGVLRFSLGSYRTSRRGIANRRRDWKPPLVHDARRRIGRSTTRAAAISKFQKKLAHVSFWPLVSICPRNRAAAL